MERMSIKNLTPRQLSRRSVKEKPSVEKKKNNKPRPGADNPGNPKNPLFGNEFITPFGPLTRTDGTEIPLPPMKEV